MQAVVPAEQNENQVCVPKTSSTGEGIAKSEATILHLCGHLGFAIQTARRTWQRIGDLALKSRHQNMRS
jgi:hypothetical protein